MRAVLIVLAYMAVLVGSVWLLLGPGLNLAVRLWQSRPLWMQPGLVAARHAVDATTIDALTLANLELSSTNKALLAEVAALKAVNGNKTDSADAALRDALRDRDAAVLLAQVEQERRVEAEHRAAHWEAIARHHPSAFGVEAAFKVLDAASRNAASGVSVSLPDDTPPHGMPRPRRVIGRLS